MLKAYGASGSRSAAPADAARPPKCPSVSHISMPVEVTRRNLGVEDGGRGERLPRSVQDEEPAQ